MIQSERDAEARALFLLPDYKAETYGPELHTKPTLVLPKKPDSWGAMPETFYPLENRLATNSRRHRHGRERLKGSDPLDDTQITCGERVRGSIVLDLL